MNQMKGPFRDQPTRLIPRTRFPPITHTGLQTNMDTTIFVPRSCQEVPRFSRQEAAKKCNDFAFLHFAARGNDLMIQDSRFPSVLQHRYLPRFDFRAAATLLATVFVPRVCGTKIVVQRWQYSIKINIVKNTIHTTCLQALILIFWRI